MRLTLLESDRSFLRSAECASLSILAHIGLAWLAVGATEGGRLMPTDEREARVFFLLPPDRVAAPMRQIEILQLGAIGGAFEGGTTRTGLGAGLNVEATSKGTRRYGERSRTRGEVPFGPPPTLRLDTAFSVLEVDKMVERYEGGAAPVYPPDLIALGTEGQVRASYVVDTLGRVDTATIQVMLSDDPRFTESVRVALGAMRFRPAKRAGRSVRQLVEQSFRFRINPMTPPVRQSS
ncbi:MAG TPA: TonB family protein [Gemmatimonadales bacterium]|nr:TonB family protein [Gemmatimonadales bacterium]